VPERPNGTVSKTVVVSDHRGFKSHPLRFFSGPTLDLRRFARFARDAAGDRRGRMDDVFALAANERLALADDLDGLTDEQWGQASLCEGWRVRDVVAHLVWPTETPMLKIMVKMAAKGFNFDKLADAAARADDRTPKELVAVLRENADSRFKPPGMGPEAPLSDVIVHGYDVRRPLGITYSVAEAPARVALDFLASKKAQSSMFHKKGLADGLRFEATDVGWSHGEGASVTGSAEDVMLALGARRVALAGLSGDGADTLRSRLAG
jgi:uncharacterized protein (TIGR03083 family)